jgi:phage shock protein A
MKKDIDDLNVTLDDTSKEIKRLQDELEHCSRRSSSYEIQAHALLKKKKLKLEQDLFKEKASRHDELKKKAYIMEIEETIKELEQLLDVVMYKVSSSKTDQLKRTSDIAQASNKVDLHAPLVCEVWRQ